MKNNILTKNQTAVLAAVGANAFLRKNFYLTGGTALAAFHIPYRFSEDLDFFSEQPIDALAIQVFFKTAKKKLGFKKIDFQQSFNRNLFFLHFSGEILKTEFTYFPFPRIDRGETQYGMSVDSIQDIAVNKLFSIYQRTLARDYMDLFMICGKYGYTIASLIKQARSKFDTHIDPLQLGSQFAKAKTLSDMPRLVKPINKAQWQNFFLKEAKKLKPFILK